MTTSPKCGRAALAVLLLLAAGSTVFAQPAASPVSARHGMVVCDHHLAADIGARMLAGGGNAVDAAVATALALAVVYPQAGNLGGGGFLLYHDAQGRATSYDFRETAPAAASERMFLDPSGAVRDTSNHRGPLAVGVPGTVAGLWLAHQRHGSRPWAELVQPAIDLATGGFPCSRTCATGATGWPRPADRSTRRRAPPSWPAAPARCSRANRCGSRIWRRR